MRARRTISTFNEHRAAVNGISFCRGIDRVVSGGVDGNLRLWSAASGKEIDSARVGDEAVTAIAVLADGSTVLAGSLDGSVTAWDTLTKHTLRINNLSSVSIHRLIPSPDGKQVAVVAAGVTILNTIPTIKSVGHFGNGQLFTSATYSPDGTRLATSTEDGRILIWDLHTHHLVTTLLDYGRRINCVQMMPDGKRLVTGDRDGIVKIWNLWASPRMVGAAG